MCSQVLQRAHRTLSETRSHAPLLSAVPATTVEQTSSSAIKLRGCDYDLIPEDVFRKATGNTFQLAGVSPLTIVRVAGPPLVGVLMYASNWNPPQNCYRVSHEEAMAVTKTTHVANSADCILDDEIALCFNNGVAGISSSASTMAQMQLTIGETTSIASSSGQASSSSVIDALVQFAKRTLGADAP